MQKESTKQWIFKALAVSFIFFAGYFVCKIFFLNSKNPSGQTVVMNMAGMNMNGDASKRYTVSFTTTPEKVLPNQNVELKFKVYDAATGNEVKDYWVIMTKILHLVIVDSELKYFNHIHPTENGSEFTISTSFPKADTYHLYLNFQPADATEQQIAFTLPVGSGAPSSISTISPDTTLTKVFGNTEVSLSTDGDAGFNSSAINNMAEIFNFHLTDANSGEPITDLKPYLGAYGHLVMINEKTYEYLHVHPVVSASVNPLSGGPDIKFLPMPLFEKVDPGVYRIFAQFNRDGQIFLADFTINIK